MYLVDTQNGLKVDWAANVGYNPVGFKAWAAGGNGFCTLRVEAQLSDHYELAEDVWHYREFQKKTHYSIDCKAYPSDSFYGYVLKNSDLGKKLFDILKDGQSHKLIVTIKQASKSYVEDVGIIQLVSETWVE
jgi:hypothetical protein